LREENSIHGMTVFTSTDSRKSKMGRLPTVPKFLITVEELMEEHSRYVLVALDKHIKEMESENGQLEPMQVLLHQQNKNGFLH
jgi:hypothetical protein